MITTEVYQKALAIVLAFHEQVRLESLTIGEITELKEKPKYRNLDDAEQGDYVRCVYVHSASSYTKDRDYEVLRTNRTQLEILNDKGKKMWMMKSNGHFRLL